MNHAWIAILLPLFLSPQSDSCSAKCTKAAQGECKSSCDAKKSCETLEKALAETQKAVQGSVRHSHAALEQAHKQLEQALRVAHATDWKDVKGLETLNLDAPFAAYAVGQDGELARIEANHSLQELMEKLNKAQHERSAECKAQSDDDDEKADDSDDGDEADEPDEAAEEAEMTAEVAAMDADAAAELAQAEAEKSYQKLKEKSHKGQSFWYSQGQGQSSRQLEERVAALEQRFGVKSDEAHGSLEERVAALERLAPAPSMPQPVLRIAPRTPRAGQPGVASRAPRAFVVPAPDAPAPPAMPRSGTVEFWSRAPMPGVPASPGADAVPSTPPTPEAVSGKEMRELKKLGYAGGVGRSGMNQDLRREIEQRMQKMREEMQQLREQMTRLREELGRENGGAR